MQKRKSIQAAMNKYKASWSNRHEVNSTIRELKTKLDALNKSRKKEMKQAKTDADKNAIKLRYDDEIKYIDYLLYVINLEYYDIIGKLKS